MTRVASYSDGRSVHLRLSRRGQRFVDHAHRFRKRLIERALADWPADDRQRFARLFTAFADGLDVD